MYSLNGRKRIYIKKEDTKGTTADTLQKLIKALQPCFTIHYENSKHINYLYDYYKGGQDILFRTDKVIRPEIDNRIVVNQAKHIADFKNGYIFSEPIQYIKNSNKSILSTSDNGEEEKDKQLLLLNEFAQESRKLAVDKQSGFWSIVGGIGHTICIPNKDTDSKIPYKLYSLDPRHTFVCYSNDFTKEPLVGVTYFEDEISPDETEIHMTIYTKSVAFTCVAGKDFESVKIGDIVPNVVGEVLIVEQNYNETIQGAFEPVVPLLNALNTLTSDRMNDVEQAVQWFMKFINCDIDDEIYEKFRAKGVIIARGEPGNPVDIDAVSVNLDQSQIQMLSDYLYQQILEISNVPDRNASAGGNTGNALVIGQGWTGAETDAKSVETLLEKSQRQLLKIMLKICKSSAITNGLLDNMNAEEIDIKFTRNKTDNLLVKTQALTQLLSAGVAPLLAFELCGLFSDPQKAYELSKEYLKKYELTNQTLNNKTNGQDGSDKQIDPNQLIASVY